MIVWALRRAISTTRPICMERQTAQIWYHRCYPLIYALHSVSESCQEKEDWSVVGAPPWVCAQEKWQSSAGGTIISQGKPQGRTDADMIEAMALSKDEVKATCLAHSGWRFSRQGSNQSDTCKCLTWTLEKAMASIMLVSPANAGQNLV